MLFSETVGAASALLSAAIWSGADLFGGISSRQLHPLQVLFLNSASGVALMGLLALAWPGHPVPSPVGALWAGLAGGLGALGLIAYYRGLRLSTAAVVVPTAGVVGVLMPVVVGIFEQGLPELHVGIGFVIGLAGIWLVSRGHAGLVNHIREGLFYGVLAGFGFGFFLVLIALANSAANTPNPGGTLFISKSAGLFVALFALRTQKVRLPSFNRSLWPGIFTGLFDVGGNIFYIIATTLTRLDIAAVLSSFAPALAVFWYRVFLHEHTSRMQWTGVAMCITAVIMVTL